jgi:hypothetical protein
MDLFMKNKTLSFSPISWASSDYPTLVHRGAYVLLGTTNVLTGRSAVKVGGTDLVYVYPIGFLDRNKSLVYTNGATRVYR